MRFVSRLCILAGVLLACAATALAVPVDGVLDPEYGVALSTQTTQTSLGDWPPDISHGGELDGAFAYVADDTLHLLITCSLDRFISEPLTFPNNLQLYFDTQPGGQNVLSAANPNAGGSIRLTGMTGLAFDSEFAPDYWIEGSRESFGLFYAFYAELPAGGGGAGYYLGASALGGAGELSGGASNPHGIRATMDISNAAGVTGGCDASSGAGVATGAEWAIPLAAIGNPTEPFRICALLVKPGSFGVGDVSNQALGPVPPGTCALGPANVVNLQNVPGAQYLVVDVTTPTARTSWGRLKAGHR